MSEVDEDVFLNNRDLSIKRSATEIASSHRYILINATNLCLVDPYFQPKRANTKVLSKIMDLCLLEGTGELEICIHTAHSINNVPDDQLKHQFNQLLCDQSLGNISVFFLIRWQDEYLEFDLHARYAVSNTGGIRVDRGFNEPEDHTERAKETDIVCMDERKRLNMLELFVRLNHTPGIVDVIKIF